jgi:hypothetical protein
MGGGAGTAFSIGTVALDAVAFRFAALRRGFFALMTRGVGVFSTCPGVPVT